MRKNPYQLQLVRHYANNGKTLQKTLEEHGAKCSKEGFAYLETAAHGMV